MDKKEKLWKVFSEVLSSVGLDPENYRENFEQEYETLKNENQDFQEKAIRILAKEAIDRRPRHPRPPTLDALRRAVEIDEELDKAKGQVNPADPESVELYIRQVKEAKRETERVFWEAELKKAEIMAQGFRDKGRKVISSTCLKCGLPLKHAIEFERGICSDCYNRL